MRKSRKLLNHLFGPHASMIVEGSNFPAPAPAERVELLRQTLPNETPFDYFDFLARADGGRIWFGDAGPSTFDCLRIHSVSRMHALHDSLTKLFPSLVVIGGDQGLTVSRLRYISLDSMAYCHAPAELGHYQGRRFVNRACAALLSESRRTGSCVVKIMCPNKSSHPMSGSNINLKFERRGMPLIGALGRSPE